MLDDGEVLALVMSGSSCGSSTDFAEESSH